MTGDVGSVEQFAGFRYVLELADGSPVDPSMFVTALPPGMWKPGQIFLLGSDLDQWRIVAIGELERRGYEPVSPTNGRPRSAAGRSHRG